jgi:hypothetical protein
MTIKVDQLNIIVLNLFLTIKTFLYLYIFLILISKFFAHNISLLLFFFNLSIESSVKY